MAFESGNAVVCSADDSQLQPMAADLLRIYNSGLNVAGQSVVMNTGTPNESTSELPCNLAAASRKRLRDDDDLLARQWATLLPLAEFQQNNPTGSFVIPNSTLPRFNCLRLAFDDSRPSPAATSTSGRGHSTSSLSCILNEELQSQLIKQREEIDQLVKIQGDRLKHALEEKKQRHTRSLLAVIEERVLRRMKEKEVDVEKINRRNLELEERVKQLSLESQIWQNLAKNNEAMVSSLRTNLEQVLAQSREQSKEGGAEQDAQDAESCNYVDSDDAHARTMKENRDLKEQRNCRVCRNNSVCVLLLPCRHLCLCKECDPHRSECPICGALKSASVQVYMD